MLRCIIRQETDPHFNLAAEEYFLKNAAEDTFMIWCNDPSVIIGKHQNTSREINHGFIESNHVPVIRRITGGGTVYHDPGNINFSFIYTNRKENLIDFIQFTRPVILFLEKLGLNASFEGKNNITANGYKVSGNAAHIYKNKVLHHGTLLFNARLDLLEKALAGKEDYYLDKSVRSVRAKVANINELLESKMSREEFIDLFRNFIITYFDGARCEDIRPSESEAISILANEKYRSFQWNFGYSPEYTFQNEWFINGHKYTVLLLVKEGRITHSDLKEDGNSSNDLREIENKLTGALHLKYSIVESLKKITFTDKYNAQMLNHLIQQLF